MYVCVFFNMFVVLIIVYSCGDACHHWPPGFQVDHLKVAMANLDHRWRVTQRAVGLIDLVTCFSAQSVFEGFVPCCFFLMLTAIPLFLLLFFEKKYCLHSPNPPQPGATSTSSRSCALRQRPRQRLRHFRCRPRPGRSKGLWLRIFFGGWLGEDSIRFSMQWQFSWQNQ